MDVTQSGGGPAPAEPRELESVFGRDPWVPDGLLVSRFPTDSIDFRGEVADALVQFGITEDPLPLETLHERVRPEFLKAMPTITGTPTMRSSPGLQGAYERLVAHIARDVLGHDVVFQDNPSLRFHFPVQMTDGFRAPDGTILSHHWDILSGDPIEQINCWLPIGRTTATNTLQYAPWESSHHLLMQFAETVAFDRREFGRSRTRFFEYLCAHEDVRREVVEAFRPLDMEYGEVLLFDSRLLHGTAENREYTTRISIDFRLLAVEAWEEQLARFERGELAPCYPWQEPRKGGFYETRTAFEL